MHACMSGNLGFIFHTWLCSCSIVIQEIAYEFVEEAMRIKWHGNIFWLFELLQQNLCIITITVNLFLFLAQAKCFNLIQVKGTLKLS